MSHPWLSVVLALAVMTPAGLSFPTDLAERADLDPNAVTYQVFTRLNPAGGQIIRLYDAASLRASNFNASKGTKIWCDGWGGNGEGGYFVRDQYMLDSDYNYFTFDARSFINVGLDGPREQVVNVTKQQGIHLAGFIDFLVDNGANISTFHLIGCSAGTHIAGAAGAAVTRGRIGRITGLDGPAAGIYLYEETEYRLDPSDAVFVDYMHTTGPPGTPEGFAEPCGHADFYPNGGLQMPGCPEDPNEDLLSGCSHARMILYWAESIVTKVGFVSYRCDSYEQYLNKTCTGDDIQLMGEHTSTTASGNYYLNTNADFWFAQG